MNKKLLLLTLASLSLATITATEDSDMEMSHTDNSRRSGKKGKCSRRAKNSKKTSKNFRRTHPILAAPVDAVEGAGTVAKDVLEVPGAIFGCNRCHKHRNSND
jgi:hypothetical protein